MNENKISGLLIKTCLTVQQKPAIFVLFNNYISYSGLNSFCVTELIYVFTPSRPIGNSHLTMAALWKTKRPMRYLSKHN